LISVSWDWTNWVTIADKNLWATAVYNSWDTLTANNCGGYFQWWNCYMFSFDWTEPTSRTTVDITGYWPWNYYYGDTFIVYYIWFAANSQAARTRAYNLRWWETWVVTIENVISNTGVLSVNGQTGNVTVEGWISLDANSPITVSKLWVGTEAQYQALSSYSDDTVYMTV
jgi:hypothetical protein